MKKLIEVLNLIDQPKFDSVNPHFKSKFASLSECNRVVREACKKAKGCAFYQDSQYNNGQWEIVTIFVCEEGEKELSSIPYNVDANPQKTGSAITYARRYSLCSAFSLVADEDEDGNEAAKPNDLKAQLPAAINEAARACDMNEADLKDCMRAALNLGNTIKASDLQRVLDWLKTVTIAKTVDVNEVR